MSLNYLDEFEYVPNIPAVRPRYVVFSPFRADTFPFAQARASQLGVTTLDTYVAPSVPINPGQGQGRVTAIPGNGIVLAGNAPYDGIYTGIQQE